jgi:hydrogenase maturation protein HypF
MVACDLHPDYLSAIHAEKISKELDIPIVRIQHHHAHIVSCMAEHRIDEKVIGVSLDGTGYGFDGNIWGGEFMIADYEDYTRFSHFDYVPMPGGEKAVKEPWRMTFSYLFKYFGYSLDYSLLPVFRSFDNSRINLLKEMILNGINSPLSSGAGRLFDAVSSLLGLCSLQTFDSEAPMRLESAIASNVAGYYPYQTGEKVVFKDTLNSIITDIGRLSIPVIAAKFHNTVAQAILETASDMRKKTEINLVVLSGGVFQNKYLLEKTIDCLQKAKFITYINSTVPPNDGGVSLGQILIAAKKRELCV